jgi:hypothetical protein
MVGDQKQADERHQNKHPWSTSLAKNISLGGFHRHANSPLFFVNCARALNHTQYCKTSDSAWLANLGNHRFAPCGCGPLFVAMFPQQRGVFLANYAMGSRFKPRTFTGAISAPHVS